MGSSLSAFWDQSFFIPQPTFTDKELPDQTGKVHIITGGYTGIGYCLAQILYAKNATVYILGRSPSKAESAIAALKSAVPASDGRLGFIQVDLSDLPTIKPAVATFLQKERRLDVLVNNAGIMRPPKGSTSAQGYDLQLGTNVYGPFLLAVLLLPLLKETARTAQAGSVRVLWAGSTAVDLSAPKEGIEFAGDGTVRGDLDPGTMYGASKAANVLLGVELARRAGAANDGVLSCSFNPGNLQSELGRHAGVGVRLAAHVLCHPVHMGAWTELFAGWSPEVTKEKNGCYIIPWGRVGECRKSVQQAAKPVEQGGSGIAARLWEACEKVCREFNRRVTGIGRCLPICRYTLQAEQL
ncbi:NAD(P)-binding protein [Lophiostoma macrostomum CBS 122681]|uniref:NAD(P)-binding protein n=1 Tax=Lophiostoma macrostomum CBS 122681 TaxID=1314788 RepID=A0A6A6T4Z0_9PLEO|nr:NAD(P)-binding protein [Lophiostoma macrostomum CBS 122681]